MKSYCFYVLIWTMSAGLHCVSGQEKCLKPIVIIDPGHGGSDTGAIGTNGLKEKEVVMNIAKEIVRLNRALFNDSLEIYLTRYSDTLISLGDRTKLAKDLKADVFVSIHCNQAVRKAAQGIEVYVKQGDTRSEFLAEQFAFGLTEKLGFKNRGVKYANFQVLRETTICPAVLLELGFLSNLEEAQHYEKGHSLTGFALLILEMLIKFSKHV
ncbi:N-acetylmuramoyl-L-alanine amidase [Pseudozobellia sp. WGM2]|uniref:N-acetylmuramoyl-L-alanine amidase family protein n=1 Tax=Pseudozobellia sp. WGM2 TaxID=2787625 RepID=UPI001ADF91DB|nr:N-acetylmuramoyl-L-alanine amidase [Pseudozobellia sp. WGM2]